MLPRAKEIVEAADLKMQDAVDFLEEDLKNYRVGKASPTLLNGVTVDYYGTPTPLNQVASVTTPDAKTIAIQPWEKSMIAKIEKAILDANVGLTPSNNGEIIRCVVPALTEERRKELIKKARAAGETTKVTVRNARRDGVDLLKKAQKNEGLSEDGEKEGEDELQKVTDKHVKAVDALIAAKEKDILTV
ncbi:MAG: ribosome recycling factor [Bacteroidales bacterium]|nr:ribosome recycling factor [Bacteroidales bacterium]